MHLIIGGRYMGKLKYAKSLYGNAPVCDLFVESAEAFEEKILAARFVVNLQEGVRRLLEEEETEKEDLELEKKRKRARDFFVSRLYLMEDKVLIGDEIGSGVVPSDPFERLWRDETGFLYQTLAERAERVDRVWAGIPCRLKG
jgi:adenosyl cobinamide kinase/adenosyl cobinamide phosphate guanylyltransferase